MNIDALTPDQSALQKAVIEPWLTTSSGQEGEADFMTNSYKSQELDDAIQDVREIQGKPNYRKRGCCLSHRRRSPTRTRTDGLKCIKDLRTKTTNQIGQIKEDINQLTQQE